MTSIASANVSTAIVQVTAQFVVNGVSLAVAGTGFFVDPNTLLTALHALVYDGVEAVAVYARTAAGDLLSIPLGDVHLGLSPAEWHLPHGSVTSAQAGHDIAAISTDSNPVGLETGWFDVDSGFAAGQVNLSGLPGPTFTYQELSATYQDYGHGINLSHLTGVSGPGLHPGFSGGVAWIDGVVPTAVGVVTGGDSTAGGQGWAVDLSPEMEQQVVQWATSDDYMVVGSVFAAHVRAIYGLVGLVPSQEEEAYWVDQGVNHGLTVEGLYTTALTVASVRVALLYDTVFNRVPDWAGLQYWIGAMDSGMQFLEVVARFVDSPEFHTLYGAPTVPDFVELLYNNILDRPSDPAGKQYWIGQANEKGINAVIAGVSDSPEHLKILADPNPLAHVSDVQHVAAVDQVHAADVAPVSIVAQQLEIVGVSHAANSDFLLNIA